VSLFWQDWPQRRVSNEVSISTGTGRPCNSERLLPSQDVFFDVSFLDTTTESTRGRKYSWYRAYDECGRDVNVKCSPLPHFSSPLGQRMDSRQLCRSLISRADVLFQPSPTFISHLSDPPLNNAFHRT
jgi:hypothetical protein